MNKIIKSTITVFALLAAVTAYGEGADSSVKLYITGGARSNNDEYINVLFQRVPYSYGGYLNPAISIDGFIGGEYFSCSINGSTQPLPVITVDMTTTASKASLQVNTSELNCWGGTAPLQITMNCVANNQYDNSFVSNGTIKTEGVMYKYHGNAKSKYADCTFTADQKSFNTSESQYGQLEYTQYVNITH